MALILCDSFDHYDNATIGRKWDVASGVSVGNYGRRGTKGVQFSQGALVRNIANETEVIAGIAVFPSHSTFSALTMSSPGGVANTQTSKGYLLAVGFQGIAQAGIMFTNDGAIHAVAGGAFDLSSGAGGVVLLGSTGGGVLKFTGWNYVQMRIKIAGGSSGELEVYVGPTQVLNLTGIATINPFGAPPSHATQFFIGGGSFGALSGQGWTGKIDDVILMNRTAVDGSVMDNFLPGDVRVEYRKPNGAGASSDSELIGTSPAPTRWQSVDDTVPDDEVTGIALAADGDQDLYEHEDLPYDQADVFAVQGVMCASKDDAGLAVLSHVQRYDGDEVAEAPHYPAGGDYRVLVSPMHSAANGDPWTLENFNDSQFGVKRGV